MVPDEACLSSLLQNVYLIQWMHQNNLLHINLLCWIATKVFYYIHNSSKLEIPSLHLWNQQHIWGIARFSKEWNKAVKLGQQLNKGTHYFLVKGLLKIWNTQNKGRVFSPWYICMFEYEWISFKLATCISESLKWRQAPSFKYRSTQQKAIQKNINFCWPLCHEA